VDFSATFIGTHVAFSGIVRGDGFPNAEVFVLDQRSTAIPLFDYRTRSNEAGPLHRIFGAHSENQLGMFQKQVELQADGTFRTDKTYSPAVVQEK
jgi:hypothetical protein